MREPHLPEDLALAGDERVEAGGDAEEVVRRSPVLQPVERGSTSGPSDASAATASRSACSASSAAR